VGRAGAVVIRRSHGLDRSIRTRFGQRSSRMARRAALISTLKAFRCSTIAVEFRPVFQAFALPLGGPGRLPVRRCGLLAAGGGYLPHFSLPSRHVDSLPLVDHPHSVPAVDVLDYDPLLTPRTLARKCVGQLRRAAGHLVRSAEHDLTNRRVEPG
jgi:hypothetical protein